MRARTPPDELRRVYEDHVDSVYAFLAYSVPRQLAEDLTSATFEKVIRAWRSYDARLAGERTWILAIARNVLTDHYRRDALRKAASVDEHPELLEFAPLGQDWEQRTLDADELRAWMSVLAEREREVLALRYGSDLKAKDIAELLELSEANVHQIISRSLKRLREHASAEQGQPS